MAHQGPKAHANSNHHRLADAYADGYRLGVTHAIAVAHSDANFAANPDGNTNVFPNGHAFSYAECDTCDRLRGALRRGPKRSTA